MSARVLFAVNGTLMRGFDLNPTLLAHDGKFVREALTQPIYRLWSIRDLHPAMMRVSEGGAKIVVELWSMPMESLPAILLDEPKGLAIGIVFIEDGSEVPGVLGESYLCEGQKDITSFGGWRAYSAWLKAASSSVYVP